MRELPREVVLKDGVQGGKYYDMVGLPWSAEWKVVMGAVMVRRRRKRLCQHFVKKDIFTLPSEK